MGWTTLFWQAAGGRDRGTHVFATPAFLVLLPSFLSWPFTHCHSLPFSPGQISRFLSCALLIPQAFRLSRTAFCFWGQLVGSPGSFARGVRRSRVIYGDLWRAAVLWATIAFQRFLCFCIARLGQAVACFAPVSVVRSQLSFHSSPRGTPVLRQLPIVLAGLDPVAEAGVS